MPAPEEGTGTDEVPRRKCLIAEFVKEATIPPWDRSPGEGWGGAGTVRRDERYATTRCEFSAWSARICLRAERSS
jgi:hypothetical protein